MSAELLNVISTGGAGIAVIVITIIFLRFIRDERNQLMADRREERREFLARLEDITKQLELLTSCVHQSNVWHKSAEEKDNART